MAQYIDKDTLVAEIERRKYQFVSQAESFRKIGKEDKESYFAALASYVVLPLKGYKGWFSFPIKERYEDIEGEEYEFKKGDIV